MELIYDEKYGEFLQKPTCRNKRHVGFELLRILCMLLIISTHFLGHGGFQNNMSGVNYVLGKILQCIFLPSVNIFVLVSAYFLSAPGKGGYNWPRIGRLYAEVYFYSVMLFVIFTASGAVEFDWLILKNALFPIIGGRYWFFSAYMVMLIASPALNILLTRLERSSHFRLCLILVLFATLQTPLGFPGALNLNAGVSGIWFCFLYVIAAYIRRYDVVLKSVKWRICAVIAVGFSIIAYFVHSSFSSPYIVFNAVFVFLTFKSINVESKNALGKIICAISPLTFGIYLIHDSDEMRAYMYENIFKADKFYDSEYSFLIMAGFILLTFTVCAVIEFARKTAFTAVEKGVKKLCRYKRQNTI